MREFDFTIRAESLNGLRRFETQTRNSSGMIELFNGIAAEEGLQALQPLTVLFENEYLFDLIPDVEWPFPQMHIGFNKSVLCFENKIYEIDRTTSPWTTSLVLTLPGTFDETNTWHFADFEDLLLGTNGEINFWFDPFLNTWGQKLADANFPIMATFCNFRGQLVGGNLVSSWHDCDERFVAWSKIGELDLLPDKDNVAGYRPMEFSGIVQKVLPLDIGVMVYGTGGIGVLVPQGSTFGYKKLASYGIMDREAVAGDLNRHVFIDEEGWLREIRNELQIKKLGYREQFESFSDGTPVVWHETVRDAYYIGDGVDNYIFTNQGLSKSFQVAPSGGYFSGAAVGNIADDASPDEELRITTDRFDIGYRGQKTIEGMTVGASFSGQCFVSVDYRFSPAEAWRTSREVQTNLEGYARLPVAGTEFRFNLRFTDYSQVDLSYFKVKYKATDRRYDRGTSNAVAFTSRSGS